MGNNAVQCACCSQKRWPGSAYDVESCLSRPEDARGGNHPDEPAKSSRPRDMFTIAPVEEDLTHFELEMKEIRVLKAKVAQGLAEGIPNGMQPSHAFTTGAVYAGSWRSGDRHGFGTQRWPDGSVFEGQWVDSCADGLGKFLFLDGDIYIGEWRANHFHGRGTYYSADGKPVYTGQWLEGEREGSGVEVGGEPQALVRYCGHFRAGSKDGSGVCSWPDGSEYCGEWESNQITGSGRHTSEHGGRWYVGQWLESAKHGLGSYSWRDGRSYCGRYVRDQASGFGVFRWPDRRRYEGYWSAGRQHGAGQHVASDGKAELRWWLKGEAGDQIQASGRHACAEVPSGHGGVAADAGRYEL